MTSENNAKDNITELQGKRAASGHRGRSAYAAVFISLAVSAGLLLLLAAATFAWFSFKAVTGGSSVVTGYMGAELLADETTVKNYIKKHIMLTHRWKDEDEVTDAMIAAEMSELDTYTRRVKPAGQPAGPEETYYRITGREMNVITLDNVEPGQAYPVYFYVANTGQLAFTYSAGIEVKESLTGLDRLGRETREEVFNTNEYPEYEDNPAWRTRYKVLVNEQGERDPDTGEPVLDPDTGWPVDHGGHLEDVLEVYIGSTHNDIKPENYVGTVADIIGKATVSETGSTEGDTDPRNRLFTGYLIPRAAVTDTEGMVVPVHTEIYDGTELIRTIENAAELGELNFLIVAPESMEDEYQYASISISIGAYTTQVEYEKDGTDCMIYDREAHESEHT